MASLRERVVHRDNVTGKSYHPVAFNLFSGLYCKLLQMDPSVPIPQWPPFGSFAGDSISVSVAPGSPSFHSGERKGLGDGEREAPALSPLPPSLASERGGTLIYTATGPNRAGVVTELLVQKLPGRHRLPKPKSKSAGFAAFSPGHLTFTLPVEPGYYSCAYSFVEAATGRTTRVLRLGTVALAGA